MLIDSHCHLDTFVKNGEIDSVLSRAKEAGVEKLVCAGTDMNDWEVYRQLAESFPGKIFYSVGLHPENAGEDWEEQLTLLQQCFLDVPAPIAIGEIGLDEHWMPKEPAEAGVVRERQLKAFLRQLELAREHNLPIIVHARKAFSQCIDAIDKSGVDWRKVVFHCFSEGANAVKILNERGGRASFTGTLTYKNAQETREAALAQGLGKFMLETDCPYLAPQKLRGQRNEPAYIRKTAEFAAELFGISVEELERVSADNTRAFFGI